MTEELAVIKNVHFGMRDAPWPCLWFSVDTLHYGSLQILHYEDAVKLIKKHSIYKIEDLEGRPCIVEMGGTGSGTCKFKDLKK
jgi:hypothetical protein